jgi:Ca-activated chloride channel family protein
MPADGDALADALALAEQSLRRSEVPGSVLVIADGVAPAQAERISEADVTLPVQLLSVRPPGAPADAGLCQAAAVLDASVTRLTVDQSDVERLATRARTRLIAVLDQATSAHWRDAGFLLLPLIAALALFWSRRGWVVR